MKRPFTADEESEVFSTLLDLLQHPPDDDNLLAFDSFGQRLSPSPERVAGLASFVRTTPSVLTTQSSLAHYRAYQDGRSALSILKTWSAGDPQAAEAFREVSNPISRARW